MDKGNRDCPEIWGIMTIGIGPVGYVAGWRFTDGMDGGGCEFRRFLNYLYYSPYLDFPAWAAQASREAVPG
jgi:hypothetical protein